MVAATSSGLPSPGDRIAGKYDVVRVIGEGGMGVVYEVVHTRLQQRAAIKMLLSRVQAMPDVVARFEREARAACRLRSRHSVRITDVDHDEQGRAYMVMEYLEGHDLAHELHTRTRLPAAEAVDVVLQACAAMAEAHAGGVVHRDLKPSNLFLVEEGGERIVKVLDFGISKLAGEGEAHITSTFATMGTPLYMSPEQVRSAKNVDGRTDIWALGVVLYEALAGERPFQGTTTAAAAAIVADEPPPLRPLVSDLPEGLDAVVMRALEKKPEARFQDVRSLAEALTSYAGNRNALRTIDATHAVRADLTRGAVRPSSTPSFVHAETMAQTTPPRLPRSQAGVSVHGTMAARPATTELAPPSPPTPATEAAWSEHRAAPMKPARRVLFVVAGALVAALVTAAAVHATRPAPAPPMSAVPPSVSVPAPAASALAVSPAGSVLSIAPALAPAPSPSVSASPSSVPSPPLHPSSRPRPPHAPPASHSSAPPSAPPPAATNPLHL